MKRFNTIGPCVVWKHYMADLGMQLDYVRNLVEEGAYFSINRARQYGKTTLLAALAQAMAEEYCMISLDFQRFSQACFQDESSFCQSFAAEFYEEAEQVWNRGNSWAENSAAGHAEEAEPVWNRGNPSVGNCASVYEEAVRREDAGEQIRLGLASASRNAGINLRELFKLLLAFCEGSPRPVILIIDEVDSASNNQVFLDFLSQLRNSYQERELRGRPAFQSVILAGLYDIRNIRQKIRSDEEHRVNSPWNIAADFEVDMSLSEKGIAGMLYEYEADHHTGMDIPKMAGLLYDYTLGYPVLVSRLCKMMDEKLPAGLPAESARLPAEPATNSGGRETAWTEADFQEAVRLILAEKNPLFDSMLGKLEEYPVLDRMLQSLLFTGRDITYNPDEPSIDMALMFGFIRKRDGNVEIANRIFETRLYNRYLAVAEMQGQDIYKASLQDKGQFVVGGRLNMRRVLEKFVEHFHDLYHSSGAAFLEEEGRKYFLLYLKPIINGSGNYYIESRTRGLRRTDVIVDYQGEQYVIELKIWRGEEYQNRGEQQLIGYLEDYRKNKGYMVSYNFNKKKQVGVFERVIGSKVLIEAVV